MSILNCLWLTEGEAAGEVGSYELRDRASGARHSSHATEMAALAHAELIARSEGPDAVRWLALVQISDDGEITELADGDELLERQLI